MQREIFNGKRDGVKRIYGTLRYFVGENAVYEYGDILMVSTKNNEDYDLILQPDGRTRFIQLYNAHKDDPMPPVPGGGGGGGDVPGPNTVGTEQIKDGAVEMEDLNDSVKSKIQKTYDEDDETMHMDFDEADVNNSNGGG